MPVEISDWNDLDNVRNDLTGDYVLVNDLDSETDGYAGIGDDFESIASFDNKFSGNFDGQGYEIFNLVINEEPTDTEGIGLFAAVDGFTTIENLTVGAEVTNTGDVEFAITAVLAGLTREDVEIKNCVVSGSVDHMVSEPSENNRSFGGLIGQNGGLVDNCGSHVDVVALDARQAGGLVGLNRDTVIDSYATGSVEGDDFVGGLVGAASFSDEIDSYWDTETSGQSTSAGDATGLTTAEMQGSAAETNMDGFDFTNTWNTVLESDEDTSDDGYPILLSLNRENQLEAQDILVITFELSVQTNAATDIGNFAATLNGELVELDDEAEDADVFFEFGETVGQNQTPTQTLTEPATFDELIDELDANTEYEFRAVAEAQNSENETFTDGGDILTFDTDDVPEVIEVNRNPDSSFDQVSVENSFTDPSNKTITGEIAEDGDEQPPEDHDNTAHSENYAVDGDEQPPEDHDNDAHSETFAVDGDTQPPENHGNDAHTTNYTDTSPSDVDSSNWDDYEIQKNGSDGNGIINFKT